MRQSNPVTHSDYKWIFKSIVLFGFVQVFKIIIGVIKNKLIAIWLGAEGLGLMGIYGSTVSFIQAGAGLGLNQSAVRDISEANINEETHSYSHIINVVNKLILITGLLGCLITLILSKFLSEWTMGDKTHTIGYALLSITVLANIINDGKQAILKGMRQLKSLANATMIGSVVGLLVALPLYYFFGLDGIVPEMLISSICALLVSDHYIHKIHYTKSNISIRQALQTSRQMLKIGGALMLVNFLGLGAGLIIITYMRYYGGLDEVGFYSAGTTIMNSYFGVAIAALTTDYFPRISAVNKDNILIEEELNKQSSVSLIICCPLFVLFLLLLPVFIRILYSNEFLPAINFIKFGVLGTMITIVSNQVDMILVAKYKIKVFAKLAIVIRSLQVVINIAMYHWFGLFGTGISLAIMGIIHMSLITITVYKLYKIKFNSMFIRLSAYVLFFILCSFMINEIPKISIRYCTGIILSVLSIGYSLYVMKYKLDIDLYNIVLHKFIGKK